MDIIKEIYECRESADNAWNAEKGVADVLYEFVKNATPYPIDMTEAELRGRMRKNGADEFVVIGKMLFAVEEHGNCAAGFRLSLNDFKLKCYNNRMFGIFGGNEEDRWQ